MGLNKGLNRWLAAAGVVCLLAAPTVASARNAYVYIAPDGSTLITDHRIRKRGYKLRKKYTNLGSRTYGGKAKPLRPVKSSYDPLIFKTADHYGMDRAIIKAIVHAESAFDASAVSPKGATGLMQLMPGTAQRYGVRQVTDPEQNLRGGTRYFRDLLKMFGNDVARALAAYNAGEGAVQKYHGIPPYAETRGYVRKVMQLHSLYRRELGA
ncbi:MAG: lytic transglycosylase domain-containing protein [Pseudomonadota bacterium]|nr:lytic transglycosylase domain-containing protein [Pseudomonadota bacterium]